jgi:hypothetical protein
MNLTMSCETELEKPAPAVGQTVKEAAGTHQLLPLPPFYIFNLCW